MSDNSNQPRTLGGRDADDAPPASWNRPSGTAPRVGRIGGSSSGSSGSGYVGILFDSKWSLLIVLAEIEVVLLP